jgi:hypothetical protein
MEFKEKKESTGYFTIMWVMDGNDCRKIFHHE